MKLEQIGHQLVRPECVLSASSGDIYVAHYGSGVMRIRPGGQQELFAASGEERIATNGFAIHPDGSFLIADLGDRGGVWKLGRDGSLLPFVTKVHGCKLPQTNFVSIDDQQQVWITVSTRQVPRDRAFRSDVHDGFIIRTNLDGTAACIVADGLGYTNEAHVDPSGCWLYANETFARRLSRFAVRAGALGQRETVFQFDGADFPDGLAFDDDGGIWVACIVSNRVWRIDRAGQAELVLSNKDDPYCADVVAAFQSAAMRQDHIRNVPTSRLGNVSSLCFGGKDRELCYLGNLANQYILRFRSPWTGALPPHWRWI